MFQLMLAAETFGGDVSSFIFGVAAFVLGAGLVGGYRAITKKKNKKVEDFLRSLARMAAEAAEQKFGSKVAEGVDNIGATKKAYATTVVRKGLERNGVVMSPEEIDAAIEAEVGSIKSVGNFLDSVGKAARG